VVALEIDCVEVNDNHFCHHQTKTCQRRHNGCGLSTEQKTCLIIQGVTGIIENLSCYDSSSCHQAFQKVKTSAKSACDLSLEFLCDKDLCPENFYKSSCLKNKHPDF
jgi:hypothetical protein